MCNIQGGPKIGILLYALKRHQIWNNFKTFFRNQEKIGNNRLLSLKIPTHLKCVATLSCEMSMF